MKSSYYQVVGRTPWMVDHPDGETKSHLPGTIFEAKPDNASVVRGLRVNAIREVSDREATALRAAKAVTAVTPTPGTKPESAAPTSAPAPKAITPTPTAQPKPKAGSTGQ